MMLLLDFQLIRQSMKTYERFRLLDDIAIWSCRAAMHENIRRQTNLRNVRVSAWLFTESASPQSPNPILINDDYLSRMTTSLKTYLLTYCAL